MPATLPSNIREGASALKVLSFFAALAVVFLCVGYLALGPIQSLEKYSIEISNVFKSTQVLIGSSTTTDSNGGKDGSFFQIGITKISFSEDRLEISTKSKSFSFEPPQDPRAWIGVIIDPYRPLVVLAGTPFFSGDGLPIKPASNVTAIQDSQGKFSLTAESFARFPFFSEQPSTIGIIQGFYDLESFEARLILTMIDTEIDLSAQILSTEMAFPEWFRKGGYPPAFATQTFISPNSIQQKWYGVNVYTTLFKFRDGEYEFAHDAFQALAQREKAKATLSSKEIAILKKADLNRGEYNEDIAKVARKLFAFAYYSRSIGQSNELQGFWNQLHPTVRKAIESTPDFSLESQ